MSHSAWKDEYYLTVYELARTGMQRKQIAQAIGVSGMTWLKWWKTKPALRDAVRRARPGPVPTNRGMIRVENPPSFSEYVERHLPKELRPTWDKIMQALADDADVESIVETLLADKSRVFRQHIWVHALVCSNFNVGTACRLAGVPRPTIQAWVLKDPGFAGVVEQIKIMKKDFLEGALLDRVGMGDTAAIIYANRCQNKDRGYGLEKTLKLKGHFEHLHAVVTDEDLAKIPVGERRKLLALTAAAAAKKEPKIVSEVG